MAQNTNNLEKAHLGKQIADLENKMEERFKQVDQRFEQIDQRFVQIDQRLGNLEEDNQTIQSILSKMMTYTVNLDAEMKRMEERAEQRHQEILAVVERNTFNINTLEQERRVSHHQYQRLDSQISDHDIVLSDHENRLQKLEKSA